MDEIKEIKKSRGVKKGETPNWNVGEKVKKL